MNDTDAERAYFARVLRGWELYPVEIVHAAAVHPVYTSVGVVRCPCLPDPVEPRFGVCRLHGVISFESGTKVQELRELVDRLGEGRKP